MAGAIRVMAQGGIGGDTITRWRIRKYRIHQREYGFGGAEGNIQRNRAKFLPGCCHDGFVMVFRFLEALDLGTLKGVDGLLLIADREDAARFIPRAKAREEFR